MEGNLEGAVCVVVVESMTLPQERSWGEGSALKLGFRIWGVVSEHLRQRPKIRFLGLQGPKALVSV